MILVICGGSASGKTTLANSLMRDAGFEKLVTYTTRYPRAGEVDGREYFFVTESRFEEMKKHGDFTETGEYSGNQYGSPSNFSVNDDIVMVLTPEGARSIKAWISKHPGYSAFIVYLQVDRRSRLIKLLERRDDIDEAFRRSVLDEDMLKGFEKEADFTLSNPGFILGTRQCENQILAKIKEFKTGK